MTLPLSVGVKNQVKSSKESPGILGRTSECLQGVQKVLLLTLRNLAMVRDKTLPV